MKLGLQAIVPLSKADLPAENRIFRVTNYIREHLLRELGLDISVRAVAHDQTSRFSSINSLTRNASEIQSVTRS